MAKRKEALEDLCVDFIMTFEELHSILIAAGIDPENCEEAEIKMKHPQKEEASAQAEEWQKPLYRHLEGAGRYVLPASTGQAEAK